MSYFFGDSVKQLSGQAQSPKNKNYLNIEPRQTLQKRFAN
jgi:hypothetical protein